MEIKFEKIKIDKDKRTVIIQCQSVSSNSYGEKIKIKMSVLQLAKVWSADREVSDLEEGFGSPELEDKCNETRELIKRFPNVKLWDKEVECYESSIIGKREGNIELWGEDISGWNGEGILITMPIEVYDKEINGKDFNVILTPFAIKLKIEK